MSFGVIMYNQNMVKKQKGVIWIQAHFIVYIKTDYIYKEIAEDVKTRFDTSNYKLDKPFSKGKYKKVIIGLMKDNLGWKIMKEVLG